MIRALIAMLVAAIAAAFIRAVIGMIQREVSEMVNPKTPPTAPPPNAPPPGANPLRKCPVCGTYAPADKLAEGRFCSPTCANQARG
jgi:hypothetical protein